MRNMMSVVLAVACAFLVGAAHAAPPDDVLLHGQRFEGANPSDDARVETRLDADFDGDGLMDVAFVAVDDENRVLGVLLGYRSEVDIGLTPVGSVELSLDALGAAGLSLRKGVLVVEDLTGGTTAISSTWRYRYDPKASRMRLIGEDLKLYSRTNMHGWQEISSNRLTGLQIRRSAESDGEGGYAAPVETRAKVSTRPVYMEQTPSADEQPGIGG
ncbi:MAG: hypothetical protein JNJ62_00205 [Pseudoxanthomonas mexicana]|nr:hypothetical protein [Pseudoxanthomonas mexicana]